MTTFPVPTMIDTNGVSLEVFAQGAGKPVIMCHGWPEHAFSWRHQMPLGKSVAVGTDNQEP